VSPDEAAHQPAQREAEEEEGAEAEAEGEAEAEADVDEEEEEAPESGDGVDDNTSGDGGRGSIDDGGDGGAEASVRAEPPQLRLQETFERVARGTGHGQVMSTALSSASIQWVGARCSGGVDKGQVGWAV
jgi:hypothetical protein